jgi:hypothetical protein
MTILCMLFKIHLPSRFDRSVLLIPPLVRTSSLLGVSLILTPFFVVLIPLALQCLHLFSHTLVCCRLDPCDIYVFYLNAYLEPTLLKSPLFHPCSGIMPHLFHR